ncbi:hypothetical protein BC829DRAFT_379361 [Chytridium lagenaria]|nr:hypothetical protein BC829DRAFT_379361 [Chytridium lagenaria]
MIDQRKKRREKDSSTRLEEHMGFQEMKRVTNSLHTWVTDVLDSPVVLNAPLPVSDSGGYDAENTLRPISQEFKPPYSLVHSLQENLGAEVDSPILDRTTYRAKKIPHGYHARNKSIGGKGPYGAWYVSPSKWNKLMLESSKAKIKYISQ